MRQLLSCGTVAVALLFGSCDRSATSLAPPPRAGEFRVLVPTRPSTLNPNIEFDEVASIVGRSLFSQLLSLNETGRLLPELAESWSTSADGLSYTFVLRPNVRWHDGQPLTSADVRWTLEMVAADGVARQVVARIASVETPDGLTVVLRLKHPWAPFASELAGPGLMILPRHVYAGADWRTHPANQRPIGSGPFEFGEWRDDGTVVLTANDDYFRSGPYVERIVFMPAAPDAIRPMIERGDADYTLTRPPSLDGAGAGESPLRVHPLPTSARYYIAMNLRRPPFDDLRVRRALAAGVDRLEIVRTALRGRGVPAVGWYTPDVEWAYNSDVRVPDFDVAAARRLLNQAGLRAGAGGRRFRATMVVSDVAPIVDLAELLREQFARIGVALDIARVPAGEWPKRVLTGRDFDLTIVAGAQGPDPDALRQRFAADAETGAYIGYANPRFLEAVQRGARTVNLDERARAYHDAQAILAGDIPFIPLAETVKVVVHHRRVSGLPQLEARGLVGMFDFSLIKINPRTEPAQ